MKKPRESGFILVFVLAVIAVMTILTLSMAEQVVLVMQVSSSRYVNPAKS